MKKSIACRVITLILGVTLLFGTGICFAEEASTVVSGWSDPSEVAATGAKDYEIIVLEPEQVPLAEGPAALQKVCALHFVMLGAAVVLYVVLRERAVRLEAGNRELEMRINAR